MLCGYIRLLDGKGSTLRIVNEAFFFKFRVFYVSFERSYSPIITDFVNQYTSAIWNTDKLLLCKRCRCYCMNFKVRDLHLNWYTFTCQNFAQLSNGINGSVSCLYWKKFPWKRNRNRKLVCLLVHVRKQWDLPRIVGWLASNGLLTMINTNIEHQFKHTFNMWKNF